MTEIATRVQDGAAPEELTAMPKAAPDTATTFSSKPESFARQAWKRFRRHKLAIIGVVMLTFLVIAFWVAPQLVDQEFDEINVLNRAQGPSRANWFGTDDLGRDLFVRAMRGGRYSITISVITGIMTALLGGLLGALAGYFGRFVDTTVNFFVACLLTVNTLAVLLVVGVKVKMTPVSISILIALVSWFRGARVVRALILQYKEREFVLAARAAGASSTRIIQKHLMPNIAGALIVEATLLAGTAIILESTLSFVGLGVLPPETTLGTLVAEAKGVIDTSPARVLIPGGIIMSIVLAVNFIGDGLRDALDPTHELGI